MPRALKHTRLRMESLEPRTVLNGNVIAGVFGDNLILRGDNLANEIEIRIAEDGSFAVRGVNTTLNRSSADFAGQGVKNILVDLKNGPNQITVTGMPVDAPTSGGDATLALAPIQGHLAIKTGAGIDRITVEQVAIGRSFGISSGAGLDHVVVDTVSVGGNAGILTSTGNDSVEITDLAIAGYLAIDLGQGVDRLTVSTKGVPGDLANPPVGLQAAQIGINAGTGHDTVNLDYVRATDLVIDLGQGNDSLTFDRGNEIENSVLRGSSGLDRLTVAQPTGDQSQQSSQDNNDIANCLLAKFEIVDGLQATNGNLPHRLTQVPKFQLPR